MLNRIRNSVIPMLDTLGEALTQYLQSPGEALRLDISQFIDAIGAQVAQEDKELPTLLDALKRSLKNPVFAQVEHIYSQCCDLIQSLPVQYKAVFLPNYDNTWDSLASVYDAFAADPMFVTEIVITPIIRNTPHGLKIAYEDHLTPKGIPNTPFASYSFETDRPDFVFFNNPYDGINIDKFRSHNIKPYAGCMVFIPYALYRYANATRENLAKSVLTASELDGHNSCDIFIVQGQAFYEMYKDISKNGGKMVALGNPKTDNIYKSLEGWKRYPEWEKVIEGRHTFFLNTHYSTLDEERWKIWLPNLLDYIDSHEDFALIWRPHPQSFIMLEDDGHSKAEIFFRSVMERVELSERVILDRTESAVSAMMYSDAIITNPSSIVAEAVFMDKPIFLIHRRMPNVLPPERHGEYYSPQYFESFTASFKHDPQNLLLRDAVCVCRLNRPLRPGENYTEYLDGACIFEFMEDIAAGKDVKKELRGLYREQLFANREGNCGQAILQYIKSLLQE